MALSKNYHPQPSCLYRTEYWRGILCCFYRTFAITVVLLLCQTALSSEKPDGLVAAAYKEHKSAFYVDPLLKAIVQQSTKPLTDEELSIQEGVKPDEMAAIEAVKDHEAVEEDQEAEEQEAVEEDQEAEGQEAVEGDQEAEGQDAVAEGQAAVVEGQDAVAEGQDAVAEGQDAIAEAQDAVTEGQNAVTEGQNAVTEGQNAVTEGQNAVTEGQDAVTEAKTAVQDVHNAKQKTQNAVQEAHDSATDNDSSLREFTPQPAVKTVKHKRRKKQHGSTDIRHHFTHFSSKEALNKAINTWHSDAKWYKQYYPIFENGPLSRYINALPEVQRRGVKERLAKVVDDQEGTIAFQIEASDWDVDLRREKHENNSQQGKTGIFVVIFRKLLDWMFGREYLDQTLEDGRKRRRILDRSKELHITRELTEEELDKIIKAMEKLPKPYKGAEFDPFSIQEWPNLDVKQSDEFSNLDLDRLLGKSQTISGSSSNNSTGKATGKSKTSKAQKILQANNK